MDESSGGSAMDMAEALLEILPMAFGPCCVLPSGSDGEPRRSCDRKFPSSAQQALRFGFSFKLHEEHLSRLVCALYMRKASKSSPKADPVPEP
jgi:hypothetical protein